MSIKKLAKSINNLADAIRYHANMAANDTLLSGASHGSVKGKTAPQNVPKYEGKEAPTSTPFGLAAESVRNSFVKIHKPIDEGAPPPAPLTEAEANFVDPYDAPHNCSGPKFAAGLMPAPPRGAATPPKLQDFPPLPAEALEAMASANETPKPPRGRMADGTEIAGEPDPTAKAVHAPGWQTLTVEELDAAPSVETDADDLPWDERIHSGGKTLLVDGTWRLKRGVPDEEYQEVVTELKKLMAIPAPSAPVDNMPPPPPSVDAPSTTVDNLPAFIKAVTGAGIDKDVVLAAVKNAGLENVMQLGARPDLIAGIAKELGL